MQSSAPAESAAFTVGRVSASGVGADGSGSVASAQAVKSAPQRVGTCHRVMQCRFGSVLTFGENAGQSWAGVGGGVKGPAVPLTGVTVSSHGGIDDTPVMPSGQMPGPSTDPG